MRRTRPAAAATRRLSASEVVDTLRIEPIAFLHPQRRNRTEGAVPRL
jgi:hypothetical protein